LNQFKQAYYKLKTTKSSENKNSATKAHLSTVDDSEVLRY